MKAGAAVLLAPALPQVNLLPREIRQARSLGVLKRWLAASVGVTALAVATAAGVAHLQSQTADSELAQADAEAAGMLAERTPFAEVTDVRAQLDSMKAARAYGLAQEILWSDYLGALASVAPAGVGISSLDYIGATPVTAAQPSNDPMVATGVGTLSFTALAAELPDTAAWADALDTLPGFRDVRVTTASRADKGGPFRYELTGTIQVDDGALSHRFDTQSEGDS